MQIEDYFSFLAPDDIRIKGHRLGIESILYEYIQRSQTAEEIAARFPTLTLEQIHATILYYLHNKESVSKYMVDWLEEGRRNREKQKTQATPLRDRLQKLKTERMASQRGKV